MRFGQLEVLECLWPRAASEPEYTEVRAEEGLGLRCVSGPAWPCLPYISLADPELPQPLWL